MRLDASIFGLVAWLGGSAASTTTSPPEGKPNSATKRTTSVPTNTRVTFSYSGELQTSNIFVVPPGAEPEASQLGWKVNEGHNLTISRASLFVVDSDRDGDKGRLIATSTPTGDTRLGENASPAGTASTTNGASKDSNPTPGGMFREKPFGKPFGNPYGKRGPSLPPLKNLLFNVNSTTRTGSVTIHPSDYRNDKVLERRLYLSLEWFDTTARKVGSSSTKLFTASEQAQDQGTEPLKSLLADLANRNPYLPYQPEDCSDSNPPDSVSTGTTTGTQLSSMDSSTSATSNNGDGNNSLNGGAIAGIVIGSVVGVLLIIALAYFLCIRRRAGGKQQRRHIHGDVGYSSDSGAAAMMMREKDMSGVNHGSPQSAFADDGGRLHDRGAVAHENDSTNYSSTPPYQEERGVGAGIGAHQQQSSDSLPQNGYSLYNSGNGNGDQGGSTHRPQSYAADSAIGVAVSGGTSSGPNAERERNGSVGGGTVGRASHQTSRPGSEVRSPSRYAHLIEEGMTEDEIRRLEDEERQLDAAIEDAGRHGRPK